jgi:hypothetical protein
MKSAIGDTGACTAHGGGKRCQLAGCPKAAVSGGTGACIAHGGGPRCQGQGCNKPALRPLQQPQLCRQCKTAEDKAAYHRGFPQDHVKVGDWAARRAAEAAAEAAEEP